MFPSMNNNSSYPFFYNQSPSLTNLLETNTMSFQHHQELFSNYLMPSNNNIPPISENPINTLFLDAPINLGSTKNNLSISSKRANGKRGRHTKISTAQGVRDRRVRLSINIAREFFNLQDILGFDKASKTLGWLLEKSKDAIKELTSTTTIDTNELGKCLLSTSNGNVVIQDDDKQEEKDLDSNTTSKKRGRKGDRNDQSVAKAIRRTKRAKARERARERTINKKTILNQSKHTHLESSRQQRDEQNLIFYQSILGSRPTNLIPYGINKGVSNVGESVVLKSKSSRESCHDSNYDMITKDYEVGYNHYHNDHNNGGIIQTPGLSALNIINLSTEIHINAKPWDVYSNQNLH